PHRSGADGRRDVRPGPALDHRLRTQPHAQGGPSRPDPDTGGPQPPLGARAGRRRDAHHSAPARRRAQRADRARDRERDRHPRRTARRADPRTRMTRIAGARRAWLLAVFAVAFLTVGVPRWLASDGGPAASDGAAVFTKL